MAQSNALREQPSMDDILASIRRIIDAGESQGKAPEPKPEDTVLPEPEATMPPPAANDAGSDRARVPQAALPNAPRTQREQSHEMPGDIEAAVSSYLEQERSGSDEPKPHPAAGVGVEPDAPAFVMDALPEPDISEVEAALRAEFNPVDRDVLAAERQAKYGARFTEEDNGAFRQVGSLLRGKVGDVSPPQTGPRSRHAIAEEMLRPMLQEWLDNNLPSLVERLVRAEIERIARGEAAHA
jgi:cell pole-organizing protein PopZ